MVIVKKARELGHRLLASHCLIRQLRLRIAAFVTDDLIPHFHQQLQGEAGAGALTGIIQMNFNKRVRNELEHPVSDVAMGNIDRALNVSLPIFARRPHSVAVNLLMNLVINRSPENELAIILVNTE